MPNPRRVAASDPRALCIVGVAQRTTLPPGPAPEPLTSWELVAREAAADAGAADLLVSLDSVQVVYCQTWPYDDPVQRLADRLGASPRHRLYSGIGGTTPQLLVSQTAAAMQRGELDSALIVGAEALATSRAAKRAGERLAGSHRESARTPFPWQPPPGVEQAHEVYQAYETFPLWDTARRAARGIPLAEYAADTAAIMASLSSVAATNPHAWRRRARSTSEIGVTSPQNRYVGWPYHKNEVAVMDVDMAAALLLTTRAKADTSGIAEDRRVYLNASAYAEDPAGVAERDDLAASAGMAVTGAAALAAAGVELGELQFLDLYSCFPSSLWLACDALGLDPLDPRGLTVTGGLPYAGGPASGYLLHAIAGTVDRLRSGGGSALVTGVGMNLQKHVAAVYSDTPGSAPMANPQDDVDRIQPRRTVLDHYTGTAEVAAYTVVHDPANTPSVGLLVLDVPGGRTLARVREPELLLDAESRELVGQRVEVTSSGQTNEATWSTGSGADRLTG